MLIQTKKILMMPKV